MSPREEGAAGGDTGRAAAKGSVPPVRVGTATPRKPPTLAVVTSCGTRSEKDADANAAANANAKAYAGVALDRSPSSNAAAALLVGMARMTKHRREDPFGSSDYVGCAVGHSVSHSVGHSVGHTTSGTGAFGSLHPVPPEPRGGAGNPPGPLHVPSTIQGTLHGTIQSTIQGIPSRPPCALGESAAHTATLNSKLRISSSEMRIIVGVEEHWRAIRREVSKQTEEREPETEPQTQTPLSLSLAQSKAPARASSPEELPKGVTRRPSGAWQAQIYYAGKTRYIGVWDEPHQAARAYNLAREALGDLKEKLGKAAPGPQPHKAADKGTGRDSRKRKSGSSKSGSSKSNSNSNPHDLDPSSATRAARAATGPPRASGGRAASSPAPSLAASSSLSLSTSASSSLSLSTSASSTSTSLSPTAASPDHTGTTKQASSSPEQGPFKKRRVVVVDREKEPPTGPGEGAASALARAASAAPSATATEHALSHRILPGKASLAAPVSAFSSHHPSAWASRSRAVPLRGERHLAQAPPSVPIGRGAGSTQPSNTGSSNSGSNSNNNNNNKKNHHTSEKTGGPLHHPGQDLPVAQRPPPPATVQVVHPPPVPAFWPPIPYVLGPHPHAGVGLRASYHLRHPPVVVGHPKPKPGKVPHQQQHHHRGPPPGHYGPYTSATQPRPVVPRGPAGGAVQRKQAAPHAVAPFRGNNKSTGTITSTSTDPKGRGKTNNGARNCERHETSRNPTGSEGLSKQRAAENETWKAIRTEVLCVFAEKRKRRAEKAAGTHQRNEPAPAGTNPTNGNEHQHKHEHKPAKAFDKDVLRGITVRPSGKFQAQLYFGGRSRYIGVFDTQHEAASAYEMVREKIKKTTLPPKGRAAAAAAGPTTDAAVVSPLNQLLSAATSLSGHPGTTTTRTAPNAAASATTTTTLRSITPSPTPRGDGTREAARGLALAPAPRE